MKEVKTSIIPSKTQFAKIDGKHELNYEAICIFAAIGFFLDQDTYWKDEVVLKPGSTYSISDSGNVESEATNFKWHYHPRNITFKSALDDFTDLFETIIKEQTGSNRVILPLSGGLDSRTQATALKYLKADVHSYSYSFKGGFEEHIIAQKIASACDFNFQYFIIPPNYLWNNINEAASINQCYTDFTNPRQMALLQQLKAMTGQFSLGHWGDVLFDSGIGEKDENISEIDIVCAKLLKKGGLELANLLWESWGLDGEFIQYFKHRIQKLLDGIEIDNKSSKIRAFKSLYWAPRWTSVSLNYFREAHPIHLPYYDDRMCKFICEIPEAFLADRKLQIEYIKNRNPKLAAIEWQDHMPFNLYNYDQSQSFKAFKYRVKNKLKRGVKSVYGSKYIQRNWELQFLGSENAKNLESYLFDKDFEVFLRGPIAQTIYRKFKATDTAFYAHPVSILLTLAVWNSK